LTHLLQIVQNALVQTGIRRSLVGGTMAVLDSADQPQSEQPARPARTKPVPPRFWWLKRLGIAGVLLATGLVLLRIWWSYEADRRLQAKIDRYRAAGQLVTVEEFDAQLDAVEESQNAAVLLEQAIAQMVPTTQSGVFFESFLDDRSKFDTDMAAAEELMQSNAAALQLVRQARDRPQVAWSRRLSASGGVTPVYSQWRLLAKLLWFSTTYHLRAGNHTEAVETLRDFLAFGRAVDAYPDVISSLVAWVCDGLAFSIVTDHASDLLIVNGDAELAFGALPATRAQIEALIGDLLDDSALRDRAVRSHFGNRAWTLHWYEKSHILDLLIPQVVGPPVASWWRQTIGFPAQPLMTLDTARSAMNHTVAANAAAEDTWPLAASHFPPSSREVTLVQRLTHPATYNAWSSEFSTERRSVEVFFRYLANRRMAAIALAIRLYEVDHGERPQQLAELVPDYLAAIPPDPFSPEGATLRYRPEAERPVLYSVFYDGQDNGGEINLGPDGRRDPNRSDLRFYLEPELPAPVGTEPASRPEAGDDQQDVENGQGKRDYKKSS
jgi:hypothetical protein